VSSVEAEKMLAIRSQRFFQCLVLRKCIRQWESRNPVP
jgi:hypothetical protein